MYIKLMANKIINKQIYIMTNLSIPTLDLFHRDGSATKRSNQRQQPNIPYYDVLRESNKIIPPYPYPPPPLTLLEEKRLVRQRLEAEALYNAYLYRPRELLSYIPTSHRSQQPVVDQKGKKRQQCECQAQKYTVHNEKLISKNAYLNNTSRKTNSVAKFSEKQIKNVSVMKNNQVNNSEIPDKSVYISNLKMNKKENNDKSFINQISDYRQNHHSSKINLQNQKKQSIVINSVPKVLNDEKFLHTHQSVVMEESSLKQQSPRKQIKKQMKNYEVQTEDQVNRSSFLIEKIVKKIPSMVNKQTFETIIKDYYKTINSIDLELNSEDLIIDLTDLVDTKQQYFDQSKDLMLKLEALSKDKTDSGILNKLFNSKKNQSIVWPHGI